MKRLFTIGVISLFASLILFTGCEKNVAPTLTIEADVTTVYFGGTVNLTAIATDDDDDALTYAWSDNVVVDADDATIATFTAGDVAETVTITCTVSDEDEEVSGTIDIIVANTTLNTYLVQNDLDLTDMLDGWIITASAVHDNLDDYYVIDTRSEDAYNAGHIPGAVFADATTLLDVAAGCPDGKTIVVHCYKGIGATRMLVALRLSGYTDAMSMKFGMSAWGLADADSATVVYDKWTGACSDTALAYPTDWLLTATEPAADVTYDYPALATEEVEDGAARLAERVAALLTDGYDYASAPAILVDRENYFINNYWAQTDWEHYGHIAGAHRIFNNADDGETFNLESGGINKYDPSATVVTYCWTSQTSGVITAYLTVLGYDAQSLITGANGMIWSNLESHKWNSENGTPGENAPGAYELE